MPERRAQLSLFVPPEAARPIEAVREAVDPVQHGLIPAHVTLCREDELGDLAAVRARLRHAPFGPLLLRFGPPRRSHGHGLLLACTGGGERFRALRAHVLGSERIGDLSPHLTLAHPRNPRAPGNSLRATAALRGGVERAFPTVYLIEQGGGGPWRVLEAFSLPGPHAGGAARVA